jgi:hypothetical protein
MTLLSLGKAFIIAGIMSIAFVAEVAVFAALGIL